MLMEPEEAGGIRFNFGYKCRTYIALKKMFFEWVEPLKDFAAVTDNRFGQPPSPCNIVNDAHGVKFSFLDHEFYINFMHGGEKENTHLLLLTFHEADPIVKNKYNSFASFTFDNDGNSEGNKFFVAAPAQFILFVTSVLNDWMTEKLNLPDKKL